MLSRYHEKEVFVISSNEKFIQYIRENLPSGDYRIVDYARSGTEARQKMIGRNYAIAMINFPLPDESGTELASDFAENTACSVLAIVKTENQEEMREYLEPAGVFVLGKPFPHYVLQQACYDAAAAHARMQSISSENLRLQTKLLDLRVINRAKLALVHYLGMDEEAAHKFIERQAMNMRISKRAAAENILKTYENQ